MPFFKKKNTESFINGSLDFKQLIDATHFLENHPDAVYTLNLDGQIVSFNQKLSLLLGYGGKQLQHQHFSDFITSTEAARIAPFKQRALNGETVHFTAEVSHREGHTLTMNVTNIPIYQNHVIIGIYGIARDISQHIQLRLQHTCLTVKEKLTESIPGIGLLDYQATADRLSFSTYFSSLLDLSQHRLASLDYEDFLLEIHPEDRPHFQELFKSLRTNGNKTVSCHLRLNRKQQYRKHIQCHGLRFQDEHQELFSFLFQEMNPLSNKDEQNSELTSIHQFFSNVETVIYQKEYASGAVHFFANGFLDAYPSYLERFASHPSATRDLLHPDDLDEVLQADERILQGETVRLTYRLRLDNQWTWLEEIRIPLQDTIQQITGHQGIVSDITVLKQQQEEIRKLSMYDQLTGLPNRTLFLEEMDHLMRRKHPFTVLSIDFNQLNHINERIGYDTGDQWLIKTSQLLTHYLPDVYTSRIAGDHYAVLLTQPFDEVHLKKICLDLLELNTRRLPIDGYELTAELAIGVSHFQDEQTTATELLHAANRALTRAKLNKQSAYEFYTSQLDLEIYRRHQLEQSLRDAIDQDELFLEYQPKVDIWSGQILAFEALIRWDHPEWGRIPPQDFIPLSEEGQCYLPIGEWVLETACQTLQTLLKKPSAVVPISINLSSKQLLHGDFVQSVRTCLHRYQVPARYLQLELQETALLQESEFVKETLQQLHQLGIQLILDGYGSGVSSLTSLSTHPISILKLDRSFASHPEEDSRTTSLIKSIVYFAKEFQLTVVAEGIETLDQLDMFRELECNAVQGYLFSRPVSSERLAALLTQSVLQPIESLKQSPKKPLSSLHGQISITRLNGKEINVGASPILITRSTNRSVHFYASIRLPVNHQIELSLQLTDVIHPKTLIEPLALTELDNGLFHYSADYKVRAQSGQIMKALENSQQLKLDEFFNVTGGTPVNS